MIILLGLPVYPECDRNKTYRDMFYALCGVTPGKKKQMTQPKFDQIIRSIRNYCSNYVKRFVAETPSLRKRFEKINFTF